MSSFPDSSFTAAGPPETRAAADAILTELQNGIPPESIARRIKEMLEATATGPDGTTHPDWRTIEAGAKLYLTLLRPGTAADPSSLPRPGRPWCMTSLRAELSGTFPAPRRLLRPRHPSQKNPRAAGRSIWNL